MPVNANKKCPTIHHSLIISYFDIPNLNESYHLQGSLERMSIINITFPEVAHFQINKFNIDETDTQSIRASRQWIFPNSCNT